MLRRFLMFLAMTGCMSLIEDENIPGRQRMRFARWLRVLKRKQATGHGRIVDYQPYEFSDNDKWRAP